MGDILSNAKITTWKQGYGRLTKRDFVALWGEEGPSLVRGKLAAAITADANLGKTINITISNETNAEDAWTAVYKVSLSSNRHWRRRLSF